MPNYDEFDDPFFNPPEEAREDIDPICPECDGDGTTKAHICKICQGSGRQ
jgi:DnaJ-class molecular chaperone